MSHAPGAESGADLYCLVPLAKALNVLDGLPTTQGVSTGTEKGLETSCEFVGRSLQESSLQIQ